MDTSPPLIVRARMAAANHQRFAGRYLLDDRSTGAASLLVILAGHKPFLWPHTLPRIERALPAGIDVCLVTPGGVVEPLRLWARERSWSYLSNRRGHVSVAQNLAIRSHPGARIIYKLDEDIFVPEGYFEAMAEGHARVAADTEFRPGFSSPIINVNGYSYLDFLRELGLVDAWRERFETLRRAHDGVPAEQDPEAAVWLWRQTLPLDEVAARFARRPFGYSVVPHRFSIGAIVYERDLWEEMRGFGSRQGPPGLGEDEEHIAVSCSRQSRVISMLHNVFAGHFSFGRQTDAMRRAFEARLSEF